MISDDEFLERIVAGIHASTSDGAEVRWNEKINGRQFDVVVRFKLGTLSYLVLVEVKNRSRPASADDVGAFVVKARDQGANKAVFVTAAGFQSGALEVARRHGADLFTVRFDEETPELPKSGGFIMARMGSAGTEPEPPTFTFDEPELIAAIEKAILIYEDGRRFELPDEQSQMSYYAAKTALGDGRTLSDLMQSAPLFALKDREQKMQRIIAPPGTVATPPDDHFFPAGEIAALEMTVVGRMSRRMSGNVRIEPSSFRSPVVYSNVLTGESYTYSFDQLPLNMEEVVAGRFYFEVHPLRYYHCESVIDGLIRWEMVESFQNEQLVRVTFRQEAKYGAFYIPVSDRQIVARLERRLEDYRALTAKNPTRRGFRLPPKNAAAKALGSRRRKKRR